MPRAKTTPRPPRTATTQSRPPTIPTSPMPNGTSSGHCSRPRQAAGGPAPPTCERSSTPSSTTSAPDAPGTSAARLPRPGTVYGYFSGGEATAPSSGFTTHCTARCGRRPSTNPSPRRPAWTASRSRPPRSAGSRGSDGGKKVKGRKRHILVDTLGLLIAVVVTSAGVQDYHGAVPVLERVKGRCPRLEVIWADGIYEKQWLIDWCGSNAAGDCK